MNQILFIQTAFLGDIILATAAISEAHRLFPSAQIDVLVKKGNESLLENNPHIRTVYVLDKSAGKYRAIRHLIRTFRHTRYDIVFNFHRFGSSGIITALSGAGKKYGFRKNPFSRFFTKKFQHLIGDGTHEVQRNMELLREFGARNIARPELFPSDVQRTAVSVYQGTPYYCLAPASVWYTKQLPRHKWIELIDSLRPDYTIFLLGAPSDSNLCAEILQASKHPNVQNLAGKLSLLESAALMEKATRNYVNDSGPLHIASAMNAPVTTFFCSTVPAFGFGPLSDDSQILEVEDLTCKPCGLHGFRECPQGHFKCGEIHLATVKK